MNYHPQLLDRLAAEYVVGTLRGPARNRFESICRDSRVARAAVRVWEDRLVGTSLALKPVQPSAEVWTRIRKRLGFKARAYPWIARSTPLRLAMAAGIAALAIVVAWNYVLRESPVNSYAEFAATTGAQLWRVEQHADGSLSVSALSSDATPPSQKSYELWALPNGKNPVSLGLLPASGRTSHALTSQQLAALASSMKVAVSLEPQGGSPTGAPTGPVVHVVDLVKSA
jgi:anti-sigma-K factor RskA